MSKVIPSQSAEVILPMKDAEMGALLTEQYQRACNAMPEILRFGAMMMRLRRVLFHDGKASGNNVKETGIKAWIEKHAPKVKLSTAYRFEDVTLGIAQEYETLVGSKVAKQFTLPDLVAADPEKLPEPIRKKQEALFDYVAGTSQKSWLDKIRPPKADARGSNPGGFRPNALYLREWLKTEYPKHPEYLEIETFEELPAEIQKRYKAEGKRYEERLTKEQKEAIQHAADARAWCEQIVPALTMGIDQSYFLACTEEQRVHLTAALKDLQGHMDKIAKPETKKALPAK